MDEKTAKALNEMRRVFAKSHGLNESEIQMTLHHRAEEVPDYFYDIEEIECEFCGESDPEKCPHFAEIIEIECECGHQRDDHFNAGERNICGGENDCECDNFEEKSDVDKLQKIS